MTASSGAATTDGFDGMRYRADSQPQQESPQCELLDGTAAETFWQRNTPNPVMPSN